MNLCFVSYTTDFHVDTPFHAPLGGTESAICYLAIELAQLGHRVVLLSPTTNPGVYHDVICANLAVGTPEFFYSQAFDTVIVSNAPVRGPFFRSVLPMDTKLILWISHDKDQPAIQPLFDPANVRPWDAFVMISEYQRTGFINRFSLPKGLCPILRYGFSPCFENLYPDYEAFRGCKIESELVYTSTPFRGLKLLPALFKDFHAQFPETQLKVYSSMMVYQKEDRPDMQQLYAQLDSMDGVIYIGSLSQTDLAKSLKSALILAYPNTFAETSCIAVMEAMAAGCFIITSEFGALPETCDSYAELVPVTFKSVPEFVSNYSQSLVSIYQEILKNPETMFAHLWKQVTFVNQEYTWKVRAREWESLLARINSKGNAP